MITKSGNQITKTDSHRHKYADAMSEYLDYAELDWSGDVECPTGAYAISGRRIVFTDDRGFVWTETYPSSDSAGTVFDALDWYYGVWSDDEDDDEAEGRRQSSLDDANDFLSYVVSCANENLTPFSFATWRIYRPSSVLG